MRGALIQCRGDWAFYGEVFAFPKHNEAINMCWMCAASTTIPELRYTDASAAARWRATIRTHESYLAELRAVAKPIPTLLDKVIGFRLEHVMVDVLHIVDLGVAAHIIGNSCLEIMQLGQWGSAQSEQLEALSSDIASWYKKTKSSKKSRLQGKLTIDRLRSSQSWPKLKAKAAATRHLAAYAATLCQQYDDGSRHARNRRAVAELLARFYEIIGGEGMSLTTEAKRALPELGRRLCVLYNALSFEAAEQNVRKWKMVPKFHLFLHLCEIQALRFGNPRFYWAYADEDMVGHMTEIGKSCHPRTVALTAMYKWLVLSFPKK